MPKPQKLAHALQAIRRAFAQFLTIPTVVIIIFLLLSGATHVLDRIRIALGWPAFLIGTHESAASLLGTVATSIITVTSITFSLLLVAVQQGAAALTSQVYDQFLRRPANQVYFGYFIGLALYCLVILATIHPDYTPVYGVALALFLTVVALFLLIVLIYTTVDQMRPAMIIEAIRDHTLSARQSQLALLRDTRSSPRLDRPAARRVSAEDSGFLTKVDVPAIAKAAADVAPCAEIVVLSSIGDYVAFGDHIAEIRTDGERDTSELEKTLRAALSLETQRNLDTDAAFGIEQLATIGWTSVSTAKSDPQAGQLACWNLRDIMARWSDSEPIERNQDTGEPPSPVVYSDNVHEALMRAFESLAVVSSESMQHQTIAEIYRTFAILFHRLSPLAQDKVETIVLRSISALGDHVPTGRLGDALRDLRQALEKSGRTKTADALQTAWRQLEARIGLLNSRATRAAGETG